ncbi:MAG: hypothetical protein JNM56_26390 [Planctomycetia bacterium]|nr:hypothetical protein [Planctomycetia bacterium]
MSSVPCAHCTTPVEITDMHRGRRIRCPRCGEGFAVPLANAPPPTPAPTSVPARATMQAPIQEILDVSAADDILAGVLGKSVCQVCLRLAPTAPVIFHQHVGAIILHFHKHIDARLCRECIDQHFRDYTLKTFLLGWWGMPSCFLTPVFLVLNLVRYSNVGNLPPPTDGSPRSPSAPVASIPTSPEDRRAAAWRTVLPPAIILALVSSLGLLWGLFGSITLFLDLDNPPPAPPPEAAAEAQPAEEKPAEPPAKVVGKPALKVRPVKIETPEEKRRRQTTNIILWGTQGAVSFVILIGAVQMMRLRTRWLALTGSILAVVPIIGPCFCLALPIGIWSIIVLCTRNVREAFA